MGGSRRRALICMIFQIWQRSVESNVTKGAGNLGRLHQAAKKSLLLKEWSQ